MPIKFKCGCGQELTVKDELAGRQGKCPACKSTVTVPSGKPASPTLAAAGKAAAPAGRGQTTQLAGKKKPAPIEDEEEIVESGEIVEEEEEVVEEAAEIVEEEPAPKKKDGGKKKKEEVVEEVVEEVIEEVVEEVEEKPAPKKKDGVKAEKDSGKKSKKDEDEEEEKDEPKDGTKPTKRDRAAYGRAGKGMFLQLIATGVLLFSILLTIIVLIIGAAMSKSTSGGTGMFTVAKIIGVINGLCLLGSYALSVVAMSFTVSTPNRAGERNMSIAGLACTGLQTAIMLFVVIKIFTSGGSGPRYDFAANASVAQQTKVTEAPGGFHLLVFNLLPVQMFIPFVGLKWAGFGGFGGAGLNLMPNFPMLETGRMLCLAFYLAAVNKTLRNGELAKKSNMGSIIAPSLFLGFGAIMYIVDLCISGPMNIWVSTILQSVTLLVSAAAMGMIGFLAFQTRDVLYANS